MTNHKQTRFSFSDVKTANCTIKGLKILPIRLFSKIKTSLFQLLIFTTHCSTDKYHLHGAACGQFKCNTSCVLWAGTVRWKLKCFCAHMMPVLYWPCCSEWSVSGPLQKAPALLLQFNKITAHWEVHSCHVTVQLRSSSSVVLVS